MKMLHICISLLILWFVCLHIIFWVPQYQENKISDTFLNLRKANNFLPTFKYEHGPLEYLQKFHIFVPEEWYSRCRKHTVANMLTGAQYEQFNLKFLVLEPGDSSGCGESSVTQAYQNARPNTLGGIIDNVFYLIVRSQPLRPFPMKCIGKVKTEPITQVFNLILI